MGMGHLEWTDRNRLPRAVFEMVRPSQLALICWVYAFGVTVA